MCVSLSSLNKPNVKDLNVTMNISQQIILEPNNLGIASTLINQLNTITVSQFIFLSPLDSDI